jgi:hypothetical protein
MLECVSTLHLCGHRLTPLSSGCHGLLATLHDGVGALFPITQRTGLEQAVWVRDGG